MTNVCLPVVIIGLCLCTCILAASPGAGSDEARTVVRGPPPLSGIVPGGEKARTRVEETYKLRARKKQLELKQAKNEQDAAMTALDKTRALFEKGIVTKGELDDYEQKYQRANLAYEKAKINLRQTQINFLKDATRVTVTDATKYRTAEGIYMVNVTLRNDSDLSKARVAMGLGGDAATTDLASLLNIDAINVSLLGRVKSEQGVIVNPYQQTIPLLEYGQIATLTFQLIKKDVDTVKVQMEYLGTTLQLPVFLRTEDVEDLPTITASPFALEGRLGEKVFYNLDLERLASSEKSFSPVVLNLPAAIPFAFRDPASDASVTQFRFDADNPKQTWKFEVSVPEKLEKKWVDRNLQFEIIITHPSNLKHVNELQSNYRGQMIPIEEIQRFIKRHRSSRASLTLMPKGVGKIEILIANKFLEVVQDEEPKFKFTIYNSGTLELRRVTPNAFWPLEWDGTWTPRTAEVIQPDERIRFVVVAKPPPSVQIGEYSIKIECEAYSGVEKVEAVDQSFTVKVRSRRRVAGVAVLVGVLIVLVLIIAVASIRISRR